MAFQVHSRARAWRFGAFMLIFGTAVSLFCIVWGVTAFVSGDASTGLILLLTAPMTAVLSGGLGVWALWGWLHPAALRVADDTIQLVKKDHVCGQIPLANVELIRNLWDQDDRPYWDRTLALVQLGGAVGTLMVGIGETVWFWIFPDSTREKSRGIVIVLKDAEDKNTWWPRKGRASGKKRIFIKGAWELPFPEMVQRLREEEMGYLQDRGLIQVPTDSVNPFEFK